MVQRKFKELDVDGITMTDIVKWENQHQNALLHVISRKTQLMVESRI